MKFSGLKNHIKVQRLNDEIHRAEDAEMKTFRLKERKSELKWELKMMDEVDEEIAEYVKFE